MVDFRCNAELKPIQEDYREGMLITFFSSLLSFRVIAVAGVISFSKLQIKTMADKYNGTIVIIFVNLLLDALLYMY